MLGLAMILLLWSHLSNCFGYIIAIWSLLNHYNLPSWLQLNLMKTRLSFEVFSFEKLWSFGPKLFFKQNCFEFFFFWPTLLLDQNLFSDQNFFSDQKFFSDQILFNKFFFGLTFFWPIFSLLKFFFRTKIFF